MLTGVATRPQSVLAASRALAQLPEHARARVAAERLRWLSGVGRGGRSRCEF